MAQPDILADDTPWPPRVAFSPTREWQDWWRDLTSRDDVTVVAARQGFVLAARQLSELGLSRSTARTRVRRGTWSAPAVGVVAPLDVDDGAADYVIRRRRHALLTTASLLRNPGLIATARSAAVLHGLPTMRLAERAELVSAATRGLGGRASTHRYCAGLGPDDMADWYGAGVTAVARTVVDLARHSRWDGLMAADAALHEQLVTVDELDQALVRARGWPGVVKARDVLALVDGRAESPLESITRLVIHDEGLPDPQVQYQIGDYRTDLCWPERRLVLEADGLAKYTGDALQAEKRRERHLRAYGYRVERVTWDDIARNWSTTRRWLTAALSMRPSPSPLQW